MNTPTLLLRRSAASSALFSESICLSCRRNLLTASRRTFTSSAAARVATFQSYPLRPSPPSARNAVVPETSISQPIEAPLPRVHETRPPIQPERAVQPGERVSEKEAQSSRREFAPPVETSAEAKAATTATPATKKAPSPPPSQSATQAAPSTAAPTTKKPAAAKPRSKLRAPRKAAMKLTPAAVSQLAQLLDGPEPQLIRVGVRAKGCSGLQYHLEYVAKPDAFDEVVEQDGVRVVVDSKALFSIIGSEMDWVEDKLSQRFVFRNPNIKEECGCGESFMV